MVAPYKFDELKRARYLELLRKGERRGKAAAAIGMNRTMICLYMQSDPEFRDAVSMAEMTADDEVEKSLRNTANKGNVTAQIFWLCNRQPDRWHNVNRTEVTGKDGGPIQNETTHKIDLTTLTDAELAIVERLLARPEPAP